MRTTAFARKAWRYLKRNRRYWTARKAANAAMAHLAMKLKLARCPAGPIVAKIEATNVCNGTCQLCPVAHKTPGHRPYGMMEWELFTRLIDAIRKTVVTVDLTNWGESLLHPRILEMIGYAHDARMYTYLSTNLHTVGPEHVDGLMTCGLDELALSLHGLSEATYQAYQPGFAFDEAVDLIEQLVEARKRLGGERSPKIKLNFVVTAANVGEVNRVTAFADRYGVDYVISEASLNLRFRIPPAMVRDEPDAAKAIIAEQIDAWLPPVGRHDRTAYRRLLDDPALLYRGHKQYPCDWPWTRLVVNCDGGLSICCGSYAADEDLGHYEGQPIRRLWNSPAYQRCRRSFRTPPTAEPAVLCEQCPGVLL